MTYCVGIEVDEGLVFAADTRTNASLDDVRVHRKLHEFEFPGEAAFVIMAAGNLATTQLLISRLRRDVEEQRPENLRAYRHLFEVAEYVGRVLLDSQVKSRTHEAGQDGIVTQATLILGGQISGEHPGLYMIYPLGNAIAASPETPSCRSASPSTASPSWTGSCARRPGWKTLRARRSCRWTRPSAPICRSGCRSTWC